MRAQGLLQESSDHLHEERLDIWAYLFKGWASLTLKNNFLVFKQNFSPCCLQLLSFTPLHAPLRRASLSSSSWVVGDSSHFLSLLFPRLKMCSAPAIPHTAHALSLFPSQCLITAASPVSQSICCYWGVPKQDRVLLMGPHECWMEDKSHFPCSVGYHPVMQPPSLLLPWALRSFSAELLPCQSTHHLSCGSPLIFRPLEVPPSPQGPTWLVIFFCFLFLFFFFVFGKEIINLKTTSL